MVVLWNGKYKSMLKCYGLPFTLTVGTEGVESKQSGDLCNSEAWRVDKYLALLRSVCWLLRSLLPEALVA